MQVRASSSFKIMIILPQNSRETLVWLALIPFSFYSVNRIIHGTNNCIAAVMLVRIKPNIPNQAVRILDPGDLHAIL